MITCDIVLSVPLNIMNIFCCYINNYMCTMSFCLCFITHSIQNVFSSCCSLVFLVQFRETPRFSTRRRDSVASAAMYALYRSRSDPRINHILISPSSSTQSFSHLHNSQTTTDSYSGSRGTDSPCSMSLSSSSSGPGECTCTKTSLFLGVGYFHFIDLLDLRGKWLDDLLEIY